MKHIKLFEDYSKAIDNLDKLLDLLRFRRYNIDDVDYFQDHITINNLKVDVDKQGYVYIIVNKNISRCIGKISFRSKEFFKYSDGTLMELGDHILAYNEYYGIIDGFDDDMVMVEDMDGNIYLVDVDQIELEE